MVASNSSGFCSAALWSFTSHFSRRLSQRLVRRRSYCAAHTCVGPTHAAHKCAKLRARGRPKISAHKIVQQFCSAALVGPFKRLQHKGPIGARRVFVRAFTPATTSGRHARAPARVAWAKPKQGSRRPLRGLVYERLGLRPSGARIVVPTYTGGEAPVTPKECTRPTVVGKGR